MTDQSWEVLSNQFVAVAGLLYFLALLSHLVEWAALRRLPAEEVVTTGRTAMFGRLGLILTAMAAAAHLVALVGRGMAADPNRVPWGNMYEFTLSGTFVVAVAYLLLRPRLGLAWMAPSRRSSPPERSRWPGSARSSTWSRTAPGRDRPATSPGSRSRRSWTGCPTGCTRSAFPCGPSRC
jgi:hypothetical protein